MALAARGAVNLHTQKYALDDFQSAITDLDNGNVRGRAILTSEHFKKFVGGAPTLLSSTPLIISHEIDATGWGEMGEIKVD